MQLAVLLNEDKHIAKNLHGEGMEHLGEFGQVDLVTMRTGEEEKALEPFVALLEEADAGIVGERALDSLGVFTGLLGGGCTRSALLLFYCQAPAIQETRDAIVI